MKTPKDPDDGSNVDPAKAPEPKVNPQKWQYAKPNFVQPKWDYIRRSDLLSLVEVFEMFFGDGKVSNYDLEYLDYGDNPPQPHHDIYKLFVTGMAQGYFGNLGERLASPASCFLPTSKVFSFIQEKDIVGLLESRDYEIQPGLQEMIEHFSSEEMPESILQQQTESTEGTLQNAFIRDGDFWQITYNGKRLSLMKNTDGIGYIAHLLARPNESIKAMDLYESVKGVSTNDTGNMIDNVKDDSNREHETGESGGMDMLLDKEGIKLLEEEIKRLEGEIKDTAYSGTSGDMQAIEEQISTIKKTLDASTNIGGEGRPVTDDDERARQTITKGISLARNKISAHDNNLSKALKQSLKGLIYKPDPDNPIRWFITP